MTYELAVESSRWTMGGCAMRAGEVGGTIVIFAPVNTFVRTLQWCSTDPFFHSPFRRLCEHGRRRGRRTTSFTVSFFMLCQPCFHYFYVRRVWFFLFLLYYGFARPLNNLWVHGVVTVQGCLHPHISQYQRSHLISVRPG